MNLLPWIDKTTRLFDGAETTPMTERAALAKWRELGERIDQRPRGVSMSVASALYDRVDQLGKHVHKGRRVDWERKGVLDRDEEFQRDLGSFAVQVRQARHEYEEMRRAHYAGVPDGVIQLQPDSEYASVEEFLEALEEHVREGEAHIASTSLDRVS